MFINKVNGLSSNLGFKGYQHIKNDVGETIMKFNYPYDYENETCEIQIFRVVPTEKFNYKIIETPIAKFDLKKDGIEFNLQRETNLDKDEPFAYKVIRKDKNGNTIWEGADTGVKMKRSENGEYVFRVNQDEAPTQAGMATIIDEKGKPKLDKDGKPIQQQIWHDSTVEFKDDPIANYKFTLVKQNGTKPLVQGTGYLAMPDTFRPGIKYRGFDESNTGEIYEDLEYQKKMEGMVKTFSNMYGGSMAGLEALIPYLKENNFKLLFTTPIANGDDRTSHGYWNKNNMQIAPNMGTTENFNSLMVKEFKNGIAHVFDATLSSEGLEGIHVQYNMRWGDKAQSYYWFRMDSLKDSALGFGVIPENAENLRHRIVNAPYTYELMPNGKYEPVENKAYDANKETYYQIYDGTQVSQDQLSKLDQPIKMYEDLTAGKNLKINTHDDTVINYIFQINPKEYAKRIDVINELNKKFNKNIKIDSSEGTIMTAQFSNFRLDKVTEGGYVAWDANPDMVKMNYGLSAYDEKLLMAISDKSLRQHERELKIRGAMEVQDMAVQTGVYWSNKVKTAHTLYTAQTLGDAKTIEKINKLIDEGKLPEEVRLSSQRLDNILNGRYKLEPKNLNKNDIIVKSLMKLPLDSLEFGENTAGVLSTSYFSNRATTEDTIGVSRFDLMKKNNPHLVQPYEKVYNKTNDLFNNELSQFAQSVIKKVNESSNEKLIDSKGEYTEYGAYVIELLVSDIAKYALLKSLTGDKLRTKILPNGELTYNYDEIRQATTLKALGINASNPTEEAEILHKKIKNGLSNLSDADINEVADSIRTRIKGTDTLTFRIAEAMIDLSGLGLNFRLDAAKDLFDIDSIRNRDDDFNDTWSGLINFWAKYVQGVKSVNPHSYIVAEMTNINEISADTFGPDSCPYNGWTNFNNAKFNGEPDAMTKFFNETGITSEAAYAYFFTELLTSFSRDFEQGDKTSDTHDQYKHRYDLLINTRSADYLRNLYTFMGNHDKMRTIHGLALDMPLYHSTLIYRDNNIDRNRQQRLDVIKVMSGAKDIKDIPLELKLNLDNLDYFRTISSRAVAQTKLLTSSVDEDLHGIASEEDIKLIREALIDLANGNYMDSKTSEKMTKLKIKELESIENAVNEIANLAKQNGVSLTDSEIADIIKKANNLDFKNYTVKGDFNWTIPKDFGENNVADLKKILGDNYGNAMDYSVYTVQIARMIQDAAKDSPQAEKIKTALATFVKKYNRAKINENMEPLKMYESSVLARKKNGYGARDFRIAMEEAINQAEFKSGRTIANKEEIINTVYKSVTEPAVQKHLMILSFLSALCGIPTMYSGDEFADTGSEDKTKNIWLQNRMASLWSAINDPNSQIGQIKRTYQAKSIDAFSNKAKFKALQNGTPYTMDVQVDGRTRDDIRARIAEINILCNKDNGLPESSQIYKDLQKEKENLQNQVAKVAFMMQGADGDVAVSVFNAGGICHDNRVNYFKKLNIENKADRIKFFKDNNIDSLNIDNPYIPIQKRTTADAILFGAGITLPLGTIFVNALSSDKTQYIVDKIGGKLGIVRKDGKKIVMDGKTSRNGAMVLRKAFRGRPKTNSNFYNEQYNFITNAYKNSDFPETGKQLELIAR